MDDDTLLNIFLTSEDSDIVDFRNWKQIDIQEKWKINIVNEENIILNYIKKVKEYNKILTEARLYLKNNIINLDEEKVNFVNDLINYLEENSTNYANLIIFLKNNRNKWIHKSFKIYEKKNKVYKNILKKISWIEDFILWLEELKSDNKRGLAWFSFDNIWKERLLISDPIVKNLWIYNEALFLQAKFKEIKKSFKKSWITINEANELVNSLSRILFIDRRKYRRWIKKVDAFIVNIWKTIKNNIEKIEELKLTRSWEEKNKLIKEINLENQNLYILRKKLRSFISRLEKISWKINKIEFKDLLLTSSDKKWKNHSSIYNKKFLYNILIRSIFSWENIKFSNFSLEEKLVKKLSWLSKEIDIDKIKQFIEAVKVYINVGWKNNSLEVIEDFTQLLKGILDNYNLEKELLLKEIENEEFAEIKFLKENIDLLLQDIFDLEILEVNENKIYNFIRKFSSYSIWNFDKNLINLIDNIWVLKSKKFNNWDDYIRYLDLSYEIKNYILETDEILEDDLVDEFILKDKIDFLDSKILEIKNKTIEIKKIIDKYKS
jgi:hypothetical protein